MNFERVDLAHVTQEIFEQLEKIAHAKRTSLQLKSTHPGPVWVKADPQRITQVMTNLIENAVKYGNENGRVLVNLEEDKKYILDFHPRRWSRYSSRTPKPNFRAILPG